MSNSWCKVENGVVVDGPRAFADATAPDASWLPHRLEDPAHTINDNFDGSHFEVRGNEVVEVKDYSPKSAEQIADEVNGFKALATTNVAKADEKLADEATTNKADWQAYRDAWQALTSITELSWDYNAPVEPQE